ncbi:MAG: TonB-dependent receptor [Gammaproteobacteria bacterium]
MSWDTNKARFGASMVGVAVATLLGTVARAQDAPVTAFAIHEQSMDRALTEFGIATGLQVLFDSKLVEGRRSPEVVGTLTAQQALGQLLKGTTLNAAVVNARTVAIRSADVEAVAKPAANTTQGQGHFVLAQSSPRENEAGASERTSDTAQGKQPDKDDLEQVLVTANRREQRAQDVASALQVLNGGDIERNGANGFADYLSQVAGVSFRDQGGGSKRVAVRGISNLSGTDNGIAGSVSTVGLYLNDVPVQGTSLMPDLSLYDLSRIEVLKGPQGTLYGEGAMGGAIKMVLNPPDTRAFGGKADASFSNTDRGTPNYRVRGAVNVPVSDRVAARLVGSYRSDGGYIDNTATGDKNQNDSRAYSLRALVAANVTEDLSAEVLLLHDSFSQDGVSQYDKTAGDLNLPVPTPQSSDVDSSIAGLTLKYDFGPAELTSVSSYFHQDGIQNLQLDFITSALFAPFGSQQAPLIYDYTLKSFAQELRLVSQGERRLNWIVGAFYRDKKRPTIASVPIATTELAAVNASLVAAGQVPVPAGGVFLGVDYEDGYKQSAVYGEINYEITHALELTVGLRAYDEKVTFDETDHGFSLASFFNLGKQPQRNNSDSGIVPKVGLSYKLSKDALVYGLVSKGFRSPVINVNKTFGWGDEGAEADKLVSYELGAKTAWLNGRLILNGSVYYVDWSDIQMLLASTAPGDIGAFENGGDAEIRGAELETSYRVGGGTFLGATFAYTDGKIVRSLTNTIGRVLPNSPEITASAFLEQNFPLPVHNGEGYLRFDVSYTDKQAIRPVVINIPTLAGQNVFVDSYSMGNLHLGGRFGAWGAELFVDNLWDTRAELGRGAIGSNLNTTNLNLVNVSRPRTIGVSVNMSF